VKRVLESETRTRSAHEVWPALVEGFFVWFFGLDMAGSVGEGSVDVDGGWVQD
jgi:hypothetical protein